MPRSLEQLAIFAAPAVFVVFWASGFVGTKLGLVYAEPLCEAVALIQRYNPDMDDAAFIEVSAWLTHAGLDGVAEPEMLAGFCERCATSGLPVGRALLFLDTLHPVHEGSVFRWGYGPNEPTALDYGRTSQDALAAAGFDPGDVEAAERWQTSPFYRMLQTGESLWRRRLSDESVGEYWQFPDWVKAGLTDYVAIITRFDTAGVIGEMDGVYTAWGTRTAGGFTDDQIATLQRLMPRLALAIKAVALARMTRTLMQTYLGRDPGQRVLGGRIARGIAEQIDAVIWFSDLRGFTRITDTAPEHCIPLLNEYSDAVFLAINEYGGDVLKLIGDGTLAIFTAEDRAHACSAALAAAIAARHRITGLQQRRAAEGKPATDMYLGLHVGEVIYGNVGSRDRLDFTVVGPAVNEASRIAAMCRSIDQPVLISAAFAEVGDIKRRLISVGRYALRGVSRPQELYTLDPDAVGA
jgi:adenylate cyclase